jgi:uncharacterized protein YkwD
MAACGPRVHISDEGRVPGASPADELVRLINLQRSRAGLVPFPSNSMLAKAARNHAGIMAESDCVKVACGGRKASARLGDAGYGARFARFHVSAGPDNAEAALRDMMSRSRGVRLIFSNEFRHVAVGYAPGGEAGGHYWAIGFAAPVVEGREALAEEIVWLVNVERVKRGVKPMGMNAHLNRSAQFHADYMANHDCFEHLCPGGPVLSERTRAAGYSSGTVAENIAAGQSSAAEVMDSWMNSRGHRNNILDADLEDIGVGYTMLAQDGGKVRWGHYWVQNFGVD